MIDASVVPAFVVAALVIVLSPGADTFLLLRATIRGGVRDGVATMVGILIGISVLSALVVSGVGLLIAAVPGALIVLKVVGALYLLFLAVRSLLAALKLLRRHRGSARTDGGADAAAEPSSARKSGPLIVGFLTNVTNPKVLVFFLAFLPQFLGRAENAALQLAFLSLMLLGLSTVWLGILIAGAHSLRRVLTTTAFTITMEFVVAAVFFLLAVALLLSSLGAGH